MVYQGRQIGGRWSESEKKFHINVLEIKAVLFAIKSLSGQIAGKHINFYQIPQRQCAKSPIWGVSDLQSVIG